MLGLQQRFQAGLSFHKKTTHIMAAIVISGLLNVGLNFWLVPLFGYMGAAVTTFVSYAFLLALMVVLSRRYFVWGFPFKTLGRADCGSAAMGAVLYLVGNSLTSCPVTNLIVAACIGVPVYLAVLFILREPQREEIEELLNLRKRILRRIQRPIQGSRNR